MQILLKEGIQRAAEEKKKNGGRAETQEAKNRWLQQQQNHTEKIYEI